MKSYPVFDIKISKKEKKYAFSCLNSSRVGQGKFVNIFEKKLSKYVKCRYGVTTTSGTTALHLACKVIGLKDGDEVLVSSSTNMASAFAVIYCGAKPVPIDVNISDWQMDVNQIRKKINKNTKAIMVVHLFGHTVNMDIVKKIAKKYNLKIIEDCAESLGVRFKNKPVGSLGDVAAFSFYSNKTITSGEGGMITTNSRKIFEKARRFKNLGYGNKIKFQHELIGFNYRMSNLTASIGLAQLENINKIIKEKKRIFDRYVKNLNHLKEIYIPKINKNTTTKYIMWVFNIHLTKYCKFSRENIVKKLAKLKIETRDSFIPINMQKTIRKKFKSIKSGDCPNANYIMRNGFYLPSGNTLSNKDIDDISRKLIKIFKN